MTALVLACLLWLHLVVTDIRRQRSRAPATGGVATVPIRR
jgi:hypothetical protein